jgi:tight adherence protein B
MSANPVSPMSELWIVCAIVFAGVVLAVQALYRIVSRAQRDRNTIKRRLTASVGGGARRTSIDILRQERGLANLDHPRLAALNEFLAQTGLRISMATLGLSILSLTALVALALSLFLSHLWMAISVGVLIGSLSVVAYLATVRRRRIDAFTAQLPDALNIIVRSLRIGHPLASAIGLASREMRDPIATELAMTAEEIAFGQDVTTAVVNLHARVGQDDLLFFVTAVSVQSQTGGNLAEVLARLATLMRQRSTLQLKVKALSAEGRLSAWFLSAMPFILYGAVRLLSKDYFAELTGSAALVPALVYGGVSLVVANFVIYRMVNFRI